MATASEIRVPVWFWIVSGVALLWEAMGCYSYLMEVSMNSARIAALPEAERTLMQSTPAWLYAVFAVAVWVGLLGAVSLLMRRAWARSLFIVSLVAVLIQFGWWFLVQKAASVLGRSAYGLPALIVVVAVLLVWFSGVATKRGWLR